MIKEKAVSDSFILKIHSEGFVIKIRKYCNKSRHKYKKYIFFKLDKNQKILDMPSTNSINLLQPLMTAIDLL